MVPGSHFQGPGCQGSMSQGRKSKSQGFSSRVPSHRYQGLGSWVTGLCPWLCPFWQNTFQMTPSSCRNFDIKLQGHSLRHGKILKKIGKILKLDCNMKICREFPKNESQIRDSVFSIQFACCISLASLYPFLIRGWSKADLSWYTDLGNT